jgi:hypothetical protein
MVFITSLTHQLLAGSKLTFLRIASKGRLLEAVECLTERHLPVMMRAVVFPYMRVRPSARSGYCPFFYSRPRTLLPNPNCVLACIAHGVRQASTLRVLFAVELLS